MRRPSCTNFTLNPPPPPPGDDTPPPRMSLTLGIIRNYLAFDVYLIKNYEWLTDYIVKQAYFCKIIIDTILTLTIMTASI